MGSSFRALSTSFDISSAGSWTKRYVEFSKAIRNFCFFVFEPVVEVELEDLAVLDFELSFEGLVNSGGSIFIGLFYQRLKTL